MAAFPNRQSRYHRTEEEWAAVLARCREAEGRARHWQEAAERITAELSQFAYVASHDLQEPLRAVNGFLGLLRRKYRDRLDGDADRYVGFALDGVDRMHRMILSLLEYSRAYQAPCPRPHLAAAEALDLSLQDLQSEIAGCGARITRGDLPVIDADPAQLRRLFRNLIGNAILYRGPASPEIDIRCRREGEHWIFTVRDNGIGFEMQYAADIFQPFRRLHTQSEFPGAGLGLTICRRIVTGAGGEIWASSRPGGGASFHFCWPAT